MWVFTETHLSQLVDADVYKEHLNAPADMWQGAGPEV